jgi:RimJ/RimL family protein N-acetyltransferase
MIIYQIANANLENITKVQTLLYKVGLPFEDLISSDLFLIIAVENTSVIGSIGLEIKDGHGLIRSFAVASQYQKQGIGSELFSKILKEAKRQKIYTLHLLTTTAEAYFNKKGFIIKNRSDVPMCIQNTSEFSALCSLDSTYMTLDIVYSSMEIYKTETKKLVLREILSTDIEGMFELDADPEVHKYLGNNPVKNREETAKIIDYIQQQYIENNIGRWAVIEKATNCFIGWAGLKLVKQLTNHHIHYYDLGYRFIQKYWGKGYATESAIACLKYGFKEMKLNEIFAYTHPQNKSSHNVLLKSGFQYKETIEYNHETYNWYKITKEDWKKEI